MTRRRSPVHVAAVLLGAAAAAACVHVPLCERAAFRLDEYFGEHGEIAPSLADAMRRGHVVVGMDEEQVFAVLGEPARRSRGIKDAGISVSRLLRVGGLFLEATGEVFRGDSGTLFTSTGRQDVSTIGHLRAYRDLSESTNLELGGSYARGHNDQGSDFLTQLYGADVTLRWRPLRRAIYHSSAGRAELMWSDRQEPTGWQRAFGGFVWADYRLNRRWFIGGRYDWSDRAGQADIRDSGFSAVATFWPSEFTQIRGQYRRTRFGDDRPRTSSYSRRSGRMVPIPSDRGSRPPADHASPQSRPWPSSLGAER